MLLSRLIERWGAPIGAAVDPDQPLGPVCTDSRQLAAGSLFVPLVGERFDGHTFLPEAGRLGAQAALVQRGREAALPPGLAAWLVDDSLAAYQELGRLWRQELRTPVVAVTGSAGKTTTRELIRAVLAPLGPVLASSGNENNDVGVPLTLLKAGPEHRALVVEMGMRGLGEIDRLSRCAEPDIAVITNIGTAHIGRLGSRAAIATAKCEITAGLRPDGLVVIPAGDPLLEQALAQVWSGRVVRVALADAGSGSPEAVSAEATGTAAARAEAVSAEAASATPEAAAVPPPDLIGQLEEDGTVLRLGEARIPLPLEGEHNARNLLLALAVAEELGLAAGALDPLAVALPGGRSRRQNVGCITVLDETYNASPEAVLAALALLQRQPGRHFAVLGTMLELGEQSLALHRQVAERARELALDGLVIVDGGPEGEAMLAAAAGLPRLRRVSSPAEAAPLLREWLAPGDQLLLKASRGVALEQLIPLLELAG